MGEVRTREQAIEGGLLGLLIGDALGVPYEFHAARDLPPLEDIEFTPPAGFRRSHQGVPPGTWSDDGAQALCLLASLLDTGRFDVDDFAQRLVRWARDGYMAVDEVFDIGVTTRTAIQALIAGTPAPQAGPTGEYDNGNGALMRILPLALWHTGSDAQLVQDAMASATPTHGHLRSQLCCALYCMWARRVLDGESIDTAYAAAVPETRALTASLAGAGHEWDIIDPTRPPGGDGGGYVVDCLHSARLVLTAPNFVSVLKNAVGMGNDTDTTAAVAGGIAGLAFGVHAIPERWAESLRGRELLDPMLDRLLS